MFAEVLANKEALELILQFHYKILIIESDPIVVLTILESNSNKRLKYLISDCKSLMQRMDYLKLQHFFREANKLADSLVDIGRRTSITEANNNLSGSSKL